MVTQSLLDPITMAILGDVKDIFASFLEIKNGARIAQCANVCDKFAKENPFAT